MSDHPRSSAEPPWRAHGVAVAVLVAATVVSAAVLPSIIPGLDRQDGASDGQAAVTEVTDVQDEVAIATTVEATTSTSRAEPVGTDARPSTVPTRGSSTTVRTTEPVQQASLSPVPSVEDQAPQVVTIQTVPVVRNLIVEIDGRRVATDARGVIDLTPDEFDAEIAVIGVTAVPALSEVEFLQWSDGNTDEIRSAADMPGPVIELGLRVSNRVIVEIDGSAPPATFVTFVSDQVGQLAVPVGEETFVVSQQARPIDGALIAETVEYTVDPLQGDYAQTTFQVRPESLWTITG
ncbi:MAG: hypothetical protein ABIP17_08165 [Ilumatobacteraceae bacterium]